jgi:hypothetical protein
LERAQICHTSAALAWLTAIQIQQRVHLLLVYSIPGFHGEEKTGSADSSKNVKIIDTQKEVKENNSLFKKRLVQIFELKGYIKNIFASTIFCRRL